VPNSTTCGTLSSFINIGSGHSGCWRFILPFSRYGVCSQLSRENSNQLKKIHKAHLMLIPCSSHTISLSTLYTFSKDPFIHFICTILCSCCLNTSPPPPAAASLLQRIVVGIGRSQLLFPIAREKRIRPKLAFRGSGSYKGFKMQAA
jgi:hypothetical protein